MQNAGKYFGDLLRISETSQFILSLLSASVVTQSLDAVHTLASAALAAGTICGQLRVQDFQYQSTPLLHHVTTTHISLKLFLCFISLTSFIAKQNSATTLEIHKLGLQTRANGQA